jgi:two-component system heavy metal sensor histidine kinase CusS
LTRPPTAGPEDRFFIQTPIGQTIVPPEERSAPRLPVASPPYSASFAPLPDGRRLRTVTVHVAAGDSGGRVSAGTPVTVVYSRPTDQLDNLLGKLAFTLTVCGVVAGAAAAAVAVAVANRALRPLHAAADVVGVIDEQNLDPRIDDAALPPELRPVASRLNGMLERLQRAFAERRRFLADASHELRTPVAALVTTLEVSLRRKRDAAELTRTLERCLSDARYLRRLVTTLLEHARGEASARQLAADSFDAAGLLDQCAAVAEALAVDQNVAIIRSYKTPMPVVSDADRLRGVVSNLLANAVEHNCPGGTVELRAAIRGDALDCSIRDTGPGIPAEHLPHLFEPFYRGDNARRRGASPHLGLGLFIVESHLRALGGQCKVDSQPGVGTVVHVVVPGVAVSVPGSVVTVEGPAALTVSRPEVLEGEAMRR